jgi:hypothetical protein
VNAGIDLVLGIWGLQLFLPDNLMPRSLHMVKKLLGVQKGIEYEWHCCSTGDCSWKALSIRTDEDRECACPCGGSRYEVTEKPSGKSTFTPYWVGPQYRLATDANT